MSRRTIRQDVVDRLQASAAVTAIVASAKIYDSRIARIPDAGLPAIVVVTPSTRRTAYGRSDPAFKVNHELAIDCFATGSTPEALAENLDLLGEAVLTCLLSDPVFVAKFEAVTDVEDELIFDAKEVRQGLCRITMTVQISEDYPPIAATITSLDGIDLKIDMIDPGGDDGEPDGVIDGAATIDLEGDDT
jgi:Protein of unknown function (DUF3168)